MKPLEVVAIARETLGTPYGHQQRVNGLALDCAGVPAYVGLRLGVKFDDVTNYGRLPQPAEVRKALEANMLRVNKADMQFGDVAWIKFTSEPQHFAIVGDYLYGGFSLIHAYNGSGLKMVIEHRLDPQWLARIVAVWRFPGVEA
jgi:cell wall-associated NlpC family hydrolase